MPLAAGTSIGAYQVTTLLGAGGMGEVYRARDAKLNRDVALKVLPESFAIDTDRIARFKREAHLLAALNHPNIAAVYGLESANGMQALVLELVEGPTLADRLQSGRVSADEAVPIVRQIAEGLEAAHDLGIVHRDLKPANIKLRPDGIVKVLDFGLAKAVEAPEDTLGQLTASPTITSPAMTERGMILGTAAYMSPEQAKGRAADRRSDVWALGVVLYEMLAGRRPFRGDDVSDTLAAVLRAEPSWPELPPETPPALKRLLQRCLQKDARRRWQHMGDLRLELSEIEQGLSIAAPPVVPQQRRASRAALAAGAVLLAAVGVVIGRWSLPREAPPGAAPVAFTLALAPGERLAPTVRALGVSHDGRNLAYAAVRDGRQQLFLRALDRSESVPLPGTDNATYPVFSPDGASLAFFADGWIRRVSISGGATTTVVRAQAPRGLEWAGDRIVYAESASSGLSVVPASGGTPEPLTELDKSKGETNHRWPVVLPDGSGVLFSVQRRSRTDQDIEGVSFRSKARTLVRAGAYPVQILETGYLVYVVMNGDTFAAPFDVQRMALVGPSIPLPERPGYTEVPGNTSPALSPGGTMVWEPLQEPGRRLVVVGRDGARRVLEAPAHNYRQVRISPNGRRIAVVTLTGISEWDIWTVDAAGDGPLRRATVSGFNTWPVWESDDTLAYSAFENGTWRLLSRNTDLNEPPRVLLSGLPQEPAVLGRLSNQSLAYTLILPQQSVFVMRNGDQPRPLAVLQTGPFGRVLAGLSPDGRWVVYASDQSGRREVYITELSDRGATRQVSRDGGDFPVWTSGGRQLVYQRVGKDGVADMVGVTVGPDGSIGRHAILARGDYVGGRHAFDVFPDGSMLMMQELPAPAQTLQVVVNWMALRGLTTASR